jgi:dTDP-4-dehydrorhamnose 3,5-epimerase-like enzyme
MLDQAKLISLPSVVDSRGMLTAIESTRDVPFEIKRIFYMHHIIRDRGGHAHRDTDQVVIAASGSFTVELFDGKDYKLFDLNDPTQGLYIPRMIYITMSNFSSQSVCLVIANSFYDMSRSFRSKDDYLNSLRK